MVKQVPAVRGTLILGLMLAVTAGGAFGFKSAATNPGSTAPASPAPAPLGVPGKWKPIFDSEFSGSQLDRVVWNAHNGWSNQNHVTDHLANVAVRNGHAILSLASSGSGAAIATRYFRLRVGDYAEARIKFAGTGQTVYNWPAWWASGPNGRRAARTTSPRASAH
jgi:hypothetical protein